MKNYALKIDFPVTFKKKTNKNEEKKTELAKNNLSSMELLLLALSVQCPFVHAVASAVNKFFLPRPLPAAHKCRQIQTRTDYD